MSGGNIFGELAVALRRTIGSPIKKPDSDSTLDKSKSQSKGAAHKMNQILPHHGWIGRDKHEPHMINEDLGTEGFCKREVKREIGERTNKTIFSFEFSNKNPDIKPEGKLDDSRCPLKTVESLPSQFRHEDVLACTLRMPGAQQPLTKV